MIKASIHWKLKENGGRAAPPTGIGQPPYTTVVRILEVDDVWPRDDVWSLVVVKIPEESTDYDWMAYVRYWVGEAPHHELIPGRHIELYEGAKCVATGKLL